MELEWTFGLGTEGSSSRHVCAVLLVQSQNFTLQGGHLFFTSFKAGQMLPFTKPNLSESEEWEDYKTIGQSGLATCQMPCYLGSYLSLLLAECTWKDPTGLLCRPIAPSTD
ncbi:hypothetical protein BFJ63_vAg18287 [Fusarium oxysporum f. sp. narcissi]|uniref:Uncharacterized protein n=1 Tax=Fusarium oxysporum f. sp. narcissi TaxID=451672 RepID=A0A4Q2V218_FUSOX|nr:hypothetical protein BFJ63_vAg18287 [Fusarium oxysporum f. sp. narcissi]